MNSAFPSKKMRDCELAHTFCFWKLFRTFTGKMTRGLSLRMVFSLLFQDTLFVDLSTKMVVDDSENSSCISSLRYESVCETHIYGLPTTNISPEVIDMIDMTWDFAQKP